MDRTGLPPSVLAALEAVDTACTWGTRRPATAPTTRALRHLGGPAADGCALLGRLAAPWWTSEPLLVGSGDWGSPDDPPADPEHTRVGLTPLGRLALDAERGACGPVPLGLALGDLGDLGDPGDLGNAGRTAERRRGFGTAAVVAALDGPAHDPVLPVPVLATGGTVDVDLHALLAGDTVTARLGSRTHREPGDPAAPPWPPPPPPLPPELQARVTAGETVSYGWVSYAPRAFPGPSLVVTGLPPGTGTWELQLALRDRASGEPPAPPAAPPTVVDVTDRTARDVGTRVVIATSDASATVDDLDDVEAWLHTHPASHRRVTWRLPRPAVVELASWAERIAADPSGLGRLRLLARPAGPVSA